MHAISKNYGLEETIRLAINAGVDVMCFSNNIQGSDVRTVDVVHGLIKSMVASGQIKPERIDESYKRIMQLKRKLSSKDALSYKAEIARLENEVASLNEKVKSLEIKPGAAAETKKSKRKKRKSKT